MSGSGAKPDDGEMVTAVRGPDDEPCFCGRPLELETVTDVPGRSRLPPAFGFNGVGGALDLDQNPAAAAGAEGARRRRRLAWPGMGGGVRRG
jgi:hypothetical protein